MPESWEDLLPTHLKDIKAELSDAHWSWDRRHRTALFITRLEGIDEKWKWLGERLPETWSSDSLKSAPHLRFLAERLKGLEPAQELISQTVDEEFSRPFGPGKTRTRFDPRCQRSPKVGREVTSACGSL